MGETKRLSIITAGWAPTSAHLTTLAESIGALTSLTNWAIEWIFVEDGEYPELAKSVERSPYATYISAKRHVGVATARNIALRFVTGDFVCNVDQDDIIDPIGFSSLLDKLGHTDAGW